MTYIYLVENCYGDPNKVYIGKTKSTRKYAHKKTYGNQINYIIIDNINSINCKDWEPLETYWIEQFRQWGYEVMNIRKKGGSGSDFATEQTKQKISNSKKGKPNPNVSIIHKNNNYRKGKICSDLMKQKISQSNKGKLRPTSGPKRLPILQFDLSGIFIKEWKSAKEAAIYLNKPSSAITECCKNLYKRKSAYGYIWKLKL